MTLPFGPEQKLSWYAHFAPWLAHFTALPQVQIADALSFRLLHACAQLHPIYWAWSSDELVTVQHDRVPVHDDPPSAPTCLFELENVLAQDWYHWCLHQGLQDGPYERRGSIFLRSDGGMFRSLQKAATKRGGTLIRTDTLPIRTKEILALIGFGLGRRIDTPGYVVQIDLAARGPTQPIEPRPHVLVVHPSRQEFDPPAVAPDLQDLAWTMRARQGGSPTPSTDVSVGVRRTCEQGSPASTGVKRPRTDPGPTIQKDPDIHKCLELPSVGSSRKGLETIDSRSDLLRKLPR